MEGTAWVGTDEGIDFRKRRELKRRYLKMFELLIDSAFDGKPQPFMFCEGVILELYEEDDELKWRQYGGANNQ